MQFAMPTPLRILSEASNRRYSTGNCPPPSGSQRTDRAFTGTNGGRGPPHGGTRSELQAMSNSLQLT
jgi:hypothetical protein